MQNDGSPISRQIPLYCRLCSSVYSYSGYIHVKTVSVRENDTERKSSHFVFISAAKNSPKLHRNLNYDLKTVKTDKSGTVSKKIQPHTSLPLYTCHASIDGKQNAEGLVHVRITTIHCLKLNS